MLTNFDQPSPYECDFNLWIESTIAQLSRGEFEKIDLEHLIEELGGLAARDKRELEHRLEVLLTHLLKRIYVASPNDCRGWELTIREQRRQLQRLLEQSPSLRNYWDAVFDKVWQNALADVQEDYPNFQFPEQWVLNRDVQSLLGDKFW